MVGAGSQASHYGGEGKRLRGDKPHLYDTPKLLDPPFQSLVKSLSASDHNHQHQFLFRIDLIYDSVLSCLVVEMIRPKSSEFVEKRRSLEWVPFDTGKMFLFDYPL